MRCGATCRQGMKCDMYALAGNGASRARMSEVCYARWPASLPALVKGGDGRHRARRVASARKRKRAVANRHHRPGRREMAVLSADGAALRCGNEPACILPIHGCLTSPRPTALAWLMPSRKLHLRHRRYARNSASGVVTPLYGFD